MSKKPKRKQRRHPKRRRHCLSCGREVKKNDALVWFHVKPNGTCNNPWPASN